VSNDVTDNSVSNFDCLDVTCHPTQVNNPCLNPTESLVLDLLTPTCTARLLFRMGHHSSPFPFSLFIYSRI